MEEITASVVNVASSAGAWVIENRPSDLVNAGVTYGFTMGLGGVVYMLSYPYSSFTSAMLYSCFGYMHAWALTFILSAPSQMLLRDMLWAGSLFIFLKHTYESLFKSEAQKLDDHKSTITFKVTEGFVKEIKKLMAADEQKENIPFDEH